MRDWGRGSVVAALPSVQGGVPRYPRYNSRRGRERREETESPWNRQVSVSIPLVCLSCCRLTWVVHPSLDDIVQSEAGWCLLIAKLIVEVRGQHLGHVIVVLAEVWVLLLRLVVQLELVVGVAERHGGGLWDPASRPDSDLRTQLLGACSPSDRGLEKGGFSPREPQPCKETSGAQVA